MWLAPLFSMEEDTVKQRMPGLLLGAAALVVCLGLRSVGAFDGLELALHDRFVRAGQGEATGVSPVKTVAIGEAAFDRYGYPIPDDVLAQALENLMAGRPAAIGIDLYRDGPAGGSAEALAGWQRLERVVASSPEIVVSELLGAGDDRGILAPDFAQPFQIGFNNLLMDRGRVVRRGYLFAWDDGGASHQSLSLQLALRLLARDGAGIGPAASHEDWVAIGETEIPPLETTFGAYVDLDAGGYQFPLDYARADADIGTLSFDSLVENRFDPAQVEGRVLILGTDARSVKDDFNSPTSRGDAIKGYRIHGHVTDQLIRMGRGEILPRGDWGEAPELLWILGWGLAGVGLSLGLASLGWAIPAFALGLAVVFGTGFALFSSGVWVPTVAPAFAWVTAGGLAVGDRVRREAHDQKQLMSLFRRFSSRNVADTLWRQRDEFMEGGRPRPQRVTITALLSDLEGYTAASEKMPPDQLMAWIDSYMDAMTRVIESHDGHVDDYVGDGIKANFGVPIPSVTEAEVAEDARRAVRCAIEMGRTLERLNMEWESVGWPTGRQRVGLFTGEAVVGAIGSDERTKYTSVGDTINTAARLEGIGGALDFDAEPGLQRILIGERTKSLLSDEFEIADEGEHLVKGKAQPLHIYRVRSARERPNEAPKGEGEEDA